VGDRAVQIPTRACKKQILQPRHTELVTARDILCRIKAKFLDDDVCVGQCCIGEADAKYAEALEMAGASMKRIMYCAFLRIVCARSSQVSHCTISTIQGAINPLSTLVLMAEAAASARGRLDGAKRGRLWYTADSLQSKSC
jgi:hypothetical protein